MLVRLLKGERAVVSNGYKNWVVDWDEVDLTHYCYVCGEVSDISVCKRCEIKEMDNIYKSSNGKLIGDGHLHKGYRRSYWEEK